MAVPYPTRWSDRLAFEIALVLEGSGESVNDVIKRAEVSPTDFIAISKDKLFKQRVAALREDIRAKGSTFHIKARVQAEELLKTSWSLIHDPDTSPAVKADLIKSTVRWAGLEPKDNPVQTAAGGAGVSITINLGDKQVPMQIVDVEPKVIAPPEE